MKATIKAFFDFLEDYCDAKNIGLRKFGQDFAWIRIKDDDDNNDIKSIRVDLKSIVKAFFLNDNTSSQIDSLDPDPYDMGQESPETIIVIRTDYTLRNQINMKHLIPIKAILHN